MLGVRQAAVRAADDDPGPPVALTARLAAGALVLLLTACAGQQEDPPPPSSVEGSSLLASSAPCAAPSPLDAAAVPPGPVALPPGTVLTDVTQAGDLRLVTGRAPLTVDEVLAHFRTAEGFVVTRDEDEGRGGELQLFGTSGDVTVTVARLTCPQGSTGFTVASAVSQPSPPG